MRNRVSRANTYLTCSTRLEYRGRANISLSFLFNGSPRIRRSSFFAKQCNPRVEKESKESGKISTFMEVFTYSCIAILWKFLQGS